MRLSPVLPIVLLPLSSCISNSQNNPKPLPNIIIILADDLGYGDVSWNNPKAHPETPNLTRLSAQGAVLTDCYSASAMSSPSRAGLLTGRAPTRIGIHDWIKEIYKKPYSNFHLPDKEITIAELLKQKNYQTAVIGKWHLNNEFNTGNNSDPDKQGFDYWYCTPTHALPTHKNPDNFYDNGTAVGQIGTPEKPKFGSEMIADKTVEWFDNRDKTAPFFLYLPFQEPHVVCDAPQNLKQKYLDRIEQGEIPIINGTGEKGLGQAEYYGCIENMDAAIGRIIQKLEDDGLSDNTFIFFTSDNGPDTDRRYNGRLQSVGETNGLTGRKRWILEGGIRQPSFIVWNGTIEPNTTINAPVGHVDILPTLCDLAGIVPPENVTIDGTSIVKGLRGGDFGRKHKPLHWHFHSPRGGPQSAMRKDNWVITAEWDKKLPRGRFAVSKIDAIKTAQLHDFKLYDLNTDLQQTTDIKDKHMQLFDAMKAELIQIHNDVKTECPDSTLFVWTDRLQSIVDTKYK